MSTENELEMFVNEVAGKVVQYQQEQKAAENAKWGDHNYLKTLSVDEINSNWDKIKTGLKK